MRRPHRQPGLGQRLRRGVADRARNAEVGHHRVAAAQQDVGRLDVAVDDAALVRIGQRLGDFARDLERVLDRQLGLALDPVPQGLAFHVRHDVVEQALGLARFVHRQDVRMGEPCGDLHFAEEAIGAERRGELRPHHLHRHAAMVLEVLGEVDRRHPAFAQDPLDLVAAGERLLDLR